MIPIILFFPIDQQVQGVDYCQCKDRKSSVYGVKGDNDEAWTPFLERKDILVFRQEHPEMPGMYVYKMYGKFDDITANEFVEVQTDLSEFRLSWDASTAQCHSIGKRKKIQTKNFFRQMIKKNLKNCLFFTCFICLFSPLFKRCHKI